jgi:hypothetical protein
VHHIHQPLNAFRDGTQTRADLPSFFCVMQQSRVLCRRLVLARGPAPRFLSLLFRALANMPSMGSSISQFRSSNRGESVSVSTLQMTPLSDAGLRVPQLGGDYDKPIHEGRTQTI